MESIKRQVVILSLIEFMKNYDSWCGETHIQKSLYFLQTMLDVPTEFEYILYKHGPFSFELRDNLGEMRGNMLVDLRNRSPYGPSYWATETGKALIERYPKTATMYQKEIDFIAQHFSNLGVAELERLATALFITKKEEELIEDCAKRINEIKPHISVDVAAKAIQEVEKLAKDFLVS